jgi:hypothetical protein
MRDHNCIGNITVTRNAYATMQPAPPGVEHLEIGINTCSNNCLLTQIAPQEPLYASLKHPNAETVQFIVCEEISYAHPDQDYELIEELIDQLPVHFTN